MRRLYNDLYCNNYGEASMKTFGIRERVWATRVLAKSGLGRLMILGTGTVFDSSMTQIATILNVDLDKKILDVDFMNRVRLHRTSNVTIRVK